MIEDSVLKNEWHVAARSKDLNEGAIMASKILGEDLVLWRVGGKAIAWKDLCIHRGAKLSLGKVKDGCLQCPYHGWEYNSAGACVRIPAQPPNRAIPGKAKTFAYAVCEKYGAIWVCLGDPVTPEPSLPVFDGHTFKIFVSGHPLKAKATRVIENYLDFAHQPFVHEGYLGDPEKPEVEDYEVQKTEQGLEAYGLKIWQPNPDGSGVPNYSTYDYFCFRPLQASFTKQRVRSVLTATPVDEENTTGYLFGMSEFREEMDEAEAEKWSALIIGQDAGVVESQRPELLPLDLQEELHLACDKLAIAYRRWLKELGVTYGVA
ncbi:MAG: aromatic ring-hydroxylating dioxygenase subunit alpha [Verrucomicrobiae bacterium]|nr:aromatic ring-hydroxylating dioxygenase subunit alpha [Verrucomicrobiae bacterium]